MDQHVTAVSAVGRRRFPGRDFLRYQGILVGVAAAVSALFWFFVGDPSVLPTLIFTLIVGNVVGVTLELMLPLFTRLSGPAGWLLYLAVLVPVGALGSFIASLTLLAMHAYNGPHRYQFIVRNSRFGTLISILSGVAIYAVSSTRIRLEKQNRLLQNQVELGALQLDAQQADLKTAHEIQRHLLPREMPVIPGMQIACAWQPAQSVGGDYFDAFSLAASIDDGRIALVMADVSGKGISLCTAGGGPVCAVLALKPGALHKYRGREVHHLLLR